MRGTEIETESERQRQGDMHTETERQTERQRQTVRQTERQRQRDIEIYTLATTVDGSSHKGSSQDCLERRY